MQFAQFSLLATYKDFSTAKNQCMTLGPRTVYCTSLLQLAQRRAECMTALTRQQPAGERPRSGKETVLRLSGFPSA